MLTPRHVGAILIAHCNRKVSAVNVGQRRDVWPPVFLANKNIVFSFDPLRFIFTLTPQEHVLFSQVPVSTRRHFYDSISLSNTSPRMQVLVVQVECANTYSAIAIGSRYTCRHTWLTADKWGRNCGKVRRDPRIGIA